MTLIPPIFKLLQFTTIMCFLIGCEANLLIHLMSCSSEVRFHRAEFVFEWSSERLREPYNC